MSVFPLMCIPTHLYTDVYPHSLPLQRVAGTQPGVALGHVFIDEPYNRVNFTLASTDSDAVRIINVMEIHLIPELI